MDQSTHFLVIYGKKIWTVGIIVNLIVGRRKLHKPNTHVWTMSKCALNNLNLINMYYVNHKKLAFFKSVLMQNLFNIGYSILNKCSHMMETCHYVGCVFTMKLMWSLTGHQGKVQCEGRVKGNMRGKFEGKVSFVTDHMEVHGDKKWCEVMQS